MDIREEIAASNDRTKVSSAGRSKSVAHKPKENYTKQLAKRILQSNQLKGNDDEKGESDESSEGEESEEVKESESDEEANEDDESSEGESDEDKESESDEEANEDDESSEGEENEEESEEELVKNVKSKIVRGKSRKVKKDIYESDSDSKEYRAKKRVKKINSVPKTKKRKQKKVASTEKATNAS